MEEAKSEGVESTKRHVTARPHVPPPSTAQQIPKPTSLAPRPTHTKKRKLPTMDLQNSPSFKVRALLQQLRPHFLEVLRTPDFRNSKAADEIRIQMKLLMDLYKQMRKKTGIHKKFVPEYQHSSHDSKPAKENQDGKPPEQLQPRCSVEKSVQGSTKSFPLSSDKKPVDSQLQGTYIVGGSVVGWNFITFSGRKPVYYGVTKVVFRSRNDGSRDAGLPITNGFSDSATPTTV